MWDKSLEERERGEGEEIPLCVPFYGSESTSLAMEMVPLCGDGLRVRERVDWAQWENLERA